MVFPPKKEYSTRVYYPAHFYFLHLCGISHRKTFKMGENGFIEFGPPKNRGSPPPVPTLVAAPSGASRHGFSGQHTRPTPSPYSRDNKRTHLARDHRIIVCQFRLLSLILGKEREREKARVIERERKRERPRVEIERDQQKRREAENKTTTG